jgi:predicted amino acid dehydrogenase
MTATTVLETYLRAARELALDPAQARMAVLGVGSVGAAFAQLLARQTVRPRAMVLIDKPDRANRLEAVAAEVALGGIDISVELTSRDGQLDPFSACYDAGFVISAVSTPEVIDIERVAARTVLVDDSQPNCWSREAAWRRVCRTGDIAPCEAGLVDAGSIGYCSAFPFPIAELDGSGDSPIAWCCLAEGLLLALDRRLPPTVGEPTLDGLERHVAAFARFGFRTGRLQCGRHFLPVDRLRAVFAGQRPVATPVLPYIRHGEPTERAKPSTLVLT